MKGKNHYFELYEHRAPKRYGTGQMRDSPPAGNHQRDRGCQPFQLPTLGTEGQGTLVLLTTCLGYETARKPIQDGDRKLPKTTREHQPGVWVSQGLICAPKWRQRSHEGREELEEGNNIEKRGLESQARAKIPAASAGLQQKGARNKPAQTESKWALISS